MMINDRIFKLIEMLDMNPHSFAEAIGVKGPVIFNIIKGRRNKPSYDVLEKILHSFENVNPKWLLKGEGSVLTEVKDKIKVEQVAKESGLYKRKEQIDDIIAKIEEDFGLGKRASAKLRTAVYEILEDNIRYREQIIHLQESHDKVLKILRERLNLKI